MPVYDFFWLDQNEGLVKYQSEDPDFASVVGTYWNAVQAYMDPAINDVSRLEQFTDQEYAVEIINKDGKHEEKILVPVTDPDDLEDAYIEGSLDLDTVIEGT